MGRGGNPMVNNLFFRTGVRHGMFLLLYVTAALLLNQTIIAGNHSIAQATDTLLAGQAIDFSTFFPPLLVLILAGTILNYISTFCGMRYSTKVQRDIRNTVGNHILQLPYHYFDEKGTGSIITKLISDVEQSGFFFSEVLPELLTNIIIVLTISVYFVQLDVMLIFVLFLSYPVMLVVANNLSKRIMSVTKKRRIRLDDRTEAAYDAIQGIAVGRTYNLYSILKRRIDAMIDEITEHTCKSTRITSAGYLLRHVITSIPVIFCYLFALHETINGKISVGEMLAFTSLLRRMLYPLSGIVFCITSIREIGVSLSRIQEIMEQPSEQGGAQAFLPTSEMPAIAWKDVTFSYQPEHPILDGTTFSILPGEHVTFVGGSGEGKTTIFKLLCGFYSASGGEYCLFGHSYTDWNLHAARDCFSLVSQNVFLFPESIWQNVAYGKENASREEVIEACKHANIHDFIQSLPDGYDTLVGERGIRLSGGERQRISLARAFLKDSPILLLDEPTASIDTETESLIQEAIDRISAGRTVITIAHRLSTIQHSDRIFVLHHGKIAETGTHQTLLAQQGIYAGLYGKEVPAQ